VPGGTRPPPPAGGTRPQPPAGGTRPQPPAGGTRQLPPEHATQAPPARPPYRRPRRGVFLLPAGLLSIALLLVWGLTRLHADTGACPPVGSASACAGPQAPGALPRHSTTPRTRPPSPTAEPAQARDACAAGYKVTVDIGSYFAAEVTVRNTGTQAIDGWTVEFEFPQDQHVTTGWGGVFKQTQSRVRVRDLIYNGSIARGATLKIGFVGSHHTRPNRAPSRFTVNGVRCQPATGG
jgi:Cellulose binding domain